MGKGVGAARPALMDLNRRAKVRRLGAIPISRRLNLLAAWYGTDKRSQAHDYTRVYQHHLAGRRKERLTVLEIGVGGDEIASAGGASLRMWRSFFPHARVIGVDLHLKALPREDRITILQGDQTDPALLAQLAGRGPFDLVVDDGSHRGDHINITFKALWPHVNPHGLYVIEDLETAYDPAYGGGPPGTACTSASLLKELVDGSQLGGVAAVHVYKGIALVEKP
jgi:cephalosporin hydroxylase